MKHLLLVDPDRKFRQSLARSLRERALEVAEAATPDEARARLAMAQTDGLVTALRLPGISGLEFIRELRAAHATLPIVVLTGFGSIATAVETVRLGATDYLTKPSDAETVLAALRGTPAIRPGPEVKALPEVPTLDRVEWEHIQHVLVETAGNISQAARLLGLDRRSLQRKLGKHPPKR